MRLIDADGLAAKIMMELTLSTAIKEAGKYGDVRLLKEDAEHILELLKEQETEIRQLRLALDIAKGTCKGIVAGGR